MPSKKEKVISLIWETFKTKVQAEIKEANNICLTNDGKTSKHVLHLFLV